MANKKIKEKTQTDSIEANQKYRLNVLDSGCSSAELQNSSSSIFESSSSPETEDEFKESCSQSSCSEDISESSSS